MLSAISAALLVQDDRLTLAGVAVDVVLEVRRVLLEKPEDEEEEEKEAAALSCPTLAPPAVAAFIFEKPGAASWTAAAERGTGTSGASGGASSACKLGNPGDPVGDPSGETPLEEAIRISERSAGAWRCSPCRLRC
mmetsp:Transcript_47306/g.101872  ORF Transcript_47306/g.101872 Transcript_47306/m.101872 type:complete len:136 (+) Transcript_47306:1185-1592(+)